MCVCAEVVKRSSAGLLILVAEACCETGASLLSNLRLRLLVAGRTERVTQFVAASAACEETKMSNKMEDSRVGMKRLRSFADGRDEEQEVRSQM